jgi:type IV secretion system protein VirB10
VAGERRIPSVNRVRSLQSRVSAVLTIGLVSAIGLGLLVWYYSQTLTRGERAQRAAERATQQRGQGEMALPPLGAIEPPRVIAADTAPELPVAERMLGPRPPLEGVTRSGIQPSRSAGRRSVEKSTEVTVLERRLAGAVLIARSDRAHATSSAVGSKHGPSSGSDDGDAPNSRIESVAAAGSGGLGSMLMPTDMQTTRARTMPSRHLLMSKGTFVDCTLETAIDSSLPGLVTCVTATDTFSTDGEVVLLDRGTKLIGETRGQVKAGAARVFVLWSEARTPDGVIAPLESPGTDELGRSGLPGEVNRHFWERFGAALLISVVDGAIQAAAQSGSDETVVVNPSTSTQIMTEVLRSTINIPPTVLKHQGDRIQVLVARDIDFGSVYELRAREH